jgi:D-beta-D-heptose 7-phosphate kinase/D-beta-D-heptose 1-phosphate adenosyltransferase
MRLNLPAFSAARVLVIGDVMLDRYWSGPTSRVSPEAPVPVVHIKGAEERPGGAGNVALNIAALGGQVDLLGLIGPDEAGQSLDRLLRGRKVHCRFQTVEGIQTATKLRVLSRNQQLIRLDFEQDYCDVDTSLLQAEYQSSLADMGAVILSDYGKGTLCDLQPLIEQARKAGVPVLIDPKGSDFSKYRGASLITPNRSEFEAVVGCCATEAELIERAQALRKDLDLEALLVTRSEEGMSLFTAEDEPAHLPTHAREVFDVTGAGDTVIATMAAARAAGASWQDAMQVANLAAGIVVGKLGTATASVPELERALHGSSESGFGVVSEEELVERLAEAHGRGERVVMTNGVFDLLHAGHVTYLEQARKLGDRLVVAVNDDDSVRRLNKGPERPLNTLENRMTVLSALQAVDWVVPFGEDTPERLYCRVLPDVLVKGGDYKPEDLAGGDCVRKNGGEVIVLQFVEGQSTTGLVDKIRKH